MGCEYSDMILAFKLLDSCKLSSVDQKFVLTGVDYKAGLENKTLFEQMKESLKKFKGQSVVQEEDEKPVKVSDTYVAKMEEVLLAKGWKPPARKRQNSDRADAASYKGKKNKLDENFQPMRCYKCKCECTKNCNCPCRYHFADKCATKKGDEQYKESKERVEKSDLAHFMKTNLPHITEDLTFYAEDNNESEELTMFVNSRVDADKEVMIAEEVMCLATTIKNEDSVLIDCACPTTVAGEKWIMKFIQKLSKEDKKRVKLEKSERIFKFGGGEKRKSKCLLEFPCNLGGKNIKLRAEVIDAELPLLLGNNSLEKAEAVLHIGKKKAKLFGEVLDMAKTDSGHYSLSINSQPEDEVIDPNDVKCLVTESADELTDAELKKIHHTLGHNSAEKLAKLIMNAKRTSNKAETVRRLEKINANN